MYELLFNPRHQLSSAEADAAWQRAVGSGPDGLGVPAAAAALGEPLDPSALACLSPAELVALLRSRAQAVAEHAFWDSVTNRLAAGMQVGGGGAEHAFWDSVKHRPIWRLCGGEAG